MSPLSQPPAALTATGLINMMAPDLPAFAGSTASPIAANDLYVMEFMLPAAMHVANILYLPTVANGNVDCGLWDASGNLLTSHGSAVAVGTANVEQTLSLLAAQDLLAGTKYFYGLAFSSGSATFTTHSTGDIVQIFNAGRAARYTGVTLGSLANITVPPGGGVQPTRIPAVRFT